MPTAREPQQKIDARRRELAEAWPDAWARMLADWRGDGEDAVWLMYAANYLGRTAGVRWAIDPVTLGNRHDGVEAVQSDASEWRELALVILTHNHSDHIDIPLLRTLAETDAQWIVPAHTKGVAEQAGVAPSKLIEPEPMRRIDLNGLGVTPFEGLHYEYEGAWGEGQPRGGLPSTGYLIETDEKRLLLPGDTRTYDPAALPALGAVDVAFAHVWLGRSAALQNPPPLLEPFCRFAEALQPSRRLILAHLHEVGRLPEDYWDHEHVRLIKDNLISRMPRVDIHAPEFWEACAL